MRQKIRKLLENQQLMELVRYVFVGGLTTVISTVIAFLVQFLLADKSGLDASAGVLGRIVAAIEAATPGQVLIANAVSWIAAVLFAFFANRGMVFRVEGKTGIFRELGQFTLGRVASFLLLEQGLAWLMAVLGVSNIVNRLVVQVLVIVFNYVVSKFWVFRKSADRAPEEGKEAQAKTATSSQKK